MNMTICVIENGPNVMLSNQECLEGKGSRVLAAKSLAEADKLLAENTPDIILLDVKLPDGNGLDYVMKIKERHPVPVVFLTCYNEKDEIIKGLRNGGCDYVAKPHDLDVLYARLQAHLRDNGTADTLPSSVTAANLTLNLDTHRVLIDGRDALMKPMEYSLLLYFVKNKNKVLSGETLYNAVWGRTTNSDLRTVRVHIHEIRRKLLEAQADQPGPCSIETIPGQGYCFRCP